jgi:4-diphosphocytidyl-2-C-methyl-D-erythritol kinase
MRENEVNIFNLKSFAKINLGLEVGDKRPDGYHNLKTIFQTIDLCDELELKENKTGMINISGNREDIDWSGDNTVFRAFRSIYANFPVTQGFDVTVRKRIPPGSGLGGGSSNAAVVLLFLNDYFGLKIGPEELISMGKRIGADVPYFFMGGTVLGWGIGEKLKKINDLKETRLALVIPDIQVSTALVFSRFGLTSVPFESKIDIFLKTNNYNVLENNLESITFQLFPEIQRIKEKMQAYENDLAMMSGSGSALFCTMENSTPARLRRDFPGVILTRTLDFKTYRHHIGAWPSGKASVFGADIRRFESSRPRSKP